MFLLEPNVSFKTSMAPDDFGWGVQVHLQLSIVLHFWCVCNFGVCGIVYA